MQVMRHFKMGAICPAEMWAQLAEVLLRGNVNEILNTLSPELQAELRETYRERPLSFSILGDSPVQRRIEQWCLAPAARLER